MRDARARARQICGCRSSCLLPLELCSIEAGRACQCGRRACGRPLRRRRCEAGRACHFGRRACGRPLWASRLGPGSWHSGAGSWPGSWHSGAGSWHSGAGCFAGACGAGTGRSLGFRPPWIPKRMPRPWPYVRVIFCLVARVLMIRMSRLICTVVHCCSLSRFRPSQL